ncbi:MAG: RluA family pseudouridine synthase [Gemmataceae bacterium]
MDGHVDPASMRRSIEVIFEDNHCLALVKPGGLLTQGVPDGIPTLESWARDYLREKYHKKGRVYLGIPHRLDRPVSGVVLFARSSKAAARLAEQFRDRLVKKTYWGLIECRDGDPQPPPEGIWEDWLRKLQNESRTEVLPGETEGARHAVLRFQRRGLIPTGAWMEFYPVTGRMHQIRVQAASRGWPILGDAFYGASRDFVAGIESARDRPIALHARELEFLHPIRYEPVRLVAPVSSPWPDWVNEAESRGDRSV